jgi:hypothetical protein
VREMKSAVEHGKATTVVESYRGEGWRWLRTGRHSDQRGWNTGFKPSHVHDMRTPPCSTNQRATPGDRAYDRWAPRFSVFQIQNKTQK